MLFFPLGGCGGQGPMGLSASFLPMALLVLFLILAFPSANVVGQEYENNENVPTTTESSNGGEGGEGGEGEGGKGEGEGGKGEGDSDPRHELFDKEVKNNRKDKATNQFNYMCLKFGKKAQEDNGDREFCGCVPQGASDWKPQKFQYPSVDLTKGCLDTFYKVAMMPMCGNEWFDQMKMCALTQFFEDDPTKKIIEDKNKKILLLIDGCAVCDNAAKIKSIKVTHTEEEAGGMFSTCAEQKDTLDLAIADLSIDVPGGKEVNAATGSFSVPVVLYHRLCAELFGYAKQSDTFKDIKLVIEHDCVGDGGTTTIKLGNVERNEEPFAKFQVAELRGLKLDLNGGDTKQYRAKENAAGNGGMPEYEENANLKWQDANVECWQKDGNCKMG